MSGKPKIATISEYADQGCYVLMVADGEELAKSLEQGGIKVTRVAMPPDVPKRKRPQ